MKIYLLFFLVSTSLFAQDFVFDKESGRAVPSFIGQVKLFKGKSFLIKQGVKEDLQHGVRFKIGDTVETSDKAIVKVQMIDDTILTIGPNSTLEFSKFDFKDKKDRESLYTLIKGQLTSDVKTKSKVEGALKYRTKQAVLGVRGTRLLVNFNQLNGKEISQFALTEGKAVVLDERTQEKHAIGKGDHLVVVSDEENNQGNERLLLPQDELLRLDGQGIDEEKEFRPLLPFFELAKIGDNSGLVQFRDKVIVHSKGPSNEAGLRLEEKKKDWKQNLDKLNEQLKENQKGSP